MKLSEWARQQGVSYQTAWRWVKDGKMPVPVTQAPSGTWLVAEPAPAVSAVCLRSIADQIAESRTESLRQPGRPDRSLAQHQVILDAIAARQPQQVAAAMRRHVRTVAKVRLLDWDPGESPS